MRKIKFDWLENIRQAREEEVVPIYGPVSARISKIKESEMGYSRKYTFDLHFRTEVSVFNGANKEARGMLMEIAKATVLNAVHKEINSELRAIVFEVADFRSMIHESQQHRVENVVRHLNELIKATSPQLGEE